MTAVNVLHTDGAVHLLTDGAGIGEDGRLACALPKVAILPHLDAAIAVRGLSNFMPAIVQMLCSMASSFDDLRAHMERPLHQQWTWMCQETRRLGGIAGATVDLDVEVYAIGLSKWRGPEAVMVASHDRFPGLAPWSIREITRGALTPPVSPDLLDRLRSAADPLQLVPEIMGQQRRVKWSAYPGAPDFVHVGAFAQLTTVTAEGLSTRIVGRWPDRLGQMPNVDAPFEVV